MTRDEREWLGRIEGKLDRFIEQEAERGRKVEGRVTALETARAVTGRTWAMIAVVAAGASGVGNMVVAAIKG